MNHHKILGVQPGASQDEIKAAYRKLAMQHHPDREGGDEKKFKEIKAAYEGLTSDDGAGSDHSHHGFNDLRESIRAQMERAMERSPISITLKVDIKSAFNGATIPLNIQGHQTQYALRASLPQLVTYQDEIKLNGTIKPLIVQLQITSEKFKFCTVGSRDGRFFSGDLETTVDVDALTILLGGWVQVTDFLDVSYQVRIPQGMSTDTRLRVQQGGYSNFDAESNSANDRGNLYLRVNPIFKPLKELNKEQVAELHTLVHS